MIPIIQDFKTVILANGAFPENAVPLSFLKKAERIICCDGATENLLKIGIEPDYIVGDLDSISEELKKRYAHILYHNPDQETNDLTKAVNFCNKHGWTQISILGASGKREDHSLANISLLANYSKSVEIQLLTDYGSFVCIYKSASFESFQKQQVSIFSITPTTILSTQQLKYPIENKSLSSWWQGTLNEASEENFKIIMDSGCILIFREYKL